MRFWTIDEARQHAPQYEFGWTPLEVEGVEGRPYHLKADYRSLECALVPAFLDAAIAAVGPCNWWLVWMDDPTKWSGRNDHLYYRLRQSYGDYRLLAEAPCHLFHAYEETDLISFVQVAIQNLWDIHVVTDLDYGRLFISHNEWLNVTSAVDPE